MQAVEQTGVRRPADLAGPDLDGVGYPPTTTWRGQRWNAARADLGPRVRRPRNLTVLTGAQVRRVVLRRWASTCTTRSCG